MSSLTIEVLSCVLEKAAEVSNSELVFLDITFLAYIIVCFIIKRAAFLVAFFMIDVCSYFVAINVEGALLFLSYAACYCLCYWFGVLYSWKMKTINAYVIMVLFQIVTAIDAFIYPEIETVVYLYYEYIVILIHFYIISTLVRWSRIRAGLVSSFNNVFSVLGYNYNFTLLLL